MDYCRTETSLAQLKAKNMRYKKAVLQTLNIEGIKDELYEMSCSCDEVKWYFDGDGDALLNALDGDEEEEFEFRMAFTDLATKCERLYDELRWQYVTEHFDCLLVEMLGNRYNVIGYDGFEEDYFGLTQFESGLAETEAVKKLMRLTKEQLLLTFRQCMGVVVSYLDIQQRHEMLKGAIDILKNDNTSILKIIKDIEHAYEAAEEADFYGENAKRFDALVYDLETAMPGRLWVE